MRLRFEDSLAEAWYGRDCAELPEITFLRKHRLASGARIFDLGAHQCVVALALAGIVGSAGQIVAVEANRHNAQMGRKNAALNPTLPLEIVEAAVAERSGTLLFNEGLNGQVDDGSGEWGRREVRAVTIDDLSRQYGVPAVLFLDVEGFECHVLRGARETLAGRPDCFVEVHTAVGLEKFGGSVSEVASFFPADTYDLYMASDLEPNPLRYQAGHRLTQTRFYLTAVAKT